MQCATLGLMYTECNVNQSEDGLACSLKLRGKKIPEYNDFHGGHVNRLRHTLYYRQRGANARETKNLLARIFGRHILYILLE